MTTTNHTPDPYDEAIASGVHQRIAAQREAEGRDPRTGKPVEPVADATKLRVRRAALGHRCVNQEHAGDAPCGATAEVDLELGSIVRPLCVEHYRPGLRVEQRRPAGDWVIAPTDPALAFTNDVAAAITFRATPEQVTLGAFVEVVDAEGTRIGRVARATFHAPTFGPAYVVVGIELR